MVAPFHTSAPRPIVPSSAPIRQAYKHRRPRASLALIMVVLCTQLIPASPAYPYTPGIVQDPNAQRMPESFQGKVTELVDGAKREAKRWKPDATLVEIDATVSPEGKIYFGRTMGPVLEARFLFVSPASGDVLLVVHGTTHFRSVPQGHLSVGPPIPDGFIDLTEAVQLIGLQRQRSEIFGLQATLSGFRKGAGQPNGATWTFKGEEHWAVDAITREVIPRANR